MAVPESIFCTMLEQEYNAIIEGIETAIDIPSFVLARVRSNFNRLFSITYNVIDATLTVLEERLLAILRLSLVDVNDFRDDFCRTAFACQPLTDLLFSSNSTILGFLSDDQKESAKNNYEDFKNLICISGLSGMVENWTDDGLEYIYNELQKLRAKLLGQTKLDELLDKYLEAIEDAGILDFLDSLDKYSNCGFAVCDWVNTSTNYLDNFLDKNFIQKDGSGYSVVIPDFLQKVYDYDATLTTRINSLEATILQWTTNNVRDFTTGRPKDELAPGGKG